MSGLVIFMLGLKQAVQYFQVFQGMENPILFIMPGDVICGSFRCPGCVFHGNGRTGGLKHVNVIVSVSECIAVIL